MRFIDRAAAIKGFIEELNAMVGHGKAGLSFVVKHRLDEIYKFVFHFVVVNLG